jgi:uncharacterized protein
MVRNMRNRGWWGILPLLFLASMTALGSELELIEAVKRGDKDRVRLLLNSQQIDASASQADGATALAWAAHLDNQEVAELLIAAGANPNRSNDLGVTPLSLACSNGSTAMVEKLLKSGADANAARPSGETVLMTCARSGSVGAVKSLLEYGANANARESSMGQTPLMWAVAQKHPKVARTLIAHGSDVHAKSQSGFSALLFAALHGDLESSRILLAAGADVNEIGPDGMTALVVASASGHEALSVFLLEKGADPNAANSEGMTSLHYALLRGVASLEDMSASLYPRLFRPNMVDLVEALLEHGANPNSRLVKHPVLLANRGGGVLRMSLVGATPFLLAASNADLEVMRLLLAKGADPLLATGENTTALMVAAGMGRRERPEENIWSERDALEAAKILIELKADVQAVTNDGQTALHAAAYNGADSIIRFLVDEGARIDAVDTYGQTPLSIAEMVIPPGLVDLAKKPLAVHPSSAKLLRELGSTTPKETARPSRGE